MHRFRPSLLDRLLDDQPGQPAVQAERTLVPLEVLKDSVARDVEHLLNTRRPKLGWAGAADSRIGQSVLGYGLDEFSCRSVDSAQDRARICQGIAQALQTHDGRLKGVQVQLLREDGPAARLRFAIRAMLVVHPLSEPVNFDAVLQSATQHYTVSASRRVA